MASQLPEPIKEQVPLDATVGQAPFSQSFDNAALTPTAMGQLGASMALTASQELNKRRGIQAGLDPSGDVLPPLTAADKAYVDAYQNQAQATLTNQAQVLFDKAQESMASLGKLSAGSIGEYKKNLHEGLSDILELAPNDVRASLANQFTQQIESSSHHYNLQLQSQIKADSLARSNAALSQITEQIHGAAMDGKPELAEQLYKDSVAMINRGQGSSMYSASDAETLRTKSRLMYLSSAEIKKGLDARRAGKLDTYLDDLADETKKPAGISWTDWESVRNNSAKYLNNVRSLESQHAQLTASNGYVEIAKQTMTAEKMEELRQSLKETPLLYNNLAIAFATQQRKSNTAKSGSDFYAQHWDNIDALRNASSKDLNSAFDNLVALKKSVADNAGQPISQEEAEYQVAAAAALPVPAYNTKLNNYFTSGNPELMLQGLQDFNRLNQFKGNKTIGVLSNPKAMAMKTNFEGFLNQGKDTQTAAALSENLVFNQTPETIQLADAETNRVLLKQGATPSSLNSWVNSIAGISSDVHIANQAALTSAVTSMFRENMQLTGRNEERSKKMIEEGFQKVWGVSEINGRKEMTFLPPEQSIGLDKGAVPLMQLEIKDQVEAQVLETKKAYDQGQSQFYYVVKERPNFDAYMKAKDSIRAKGLQDPDYSQNAQTVKTFEKGEPVELERIYRSKKIEPFTANIQSNPYQGIDPTTGELKGDYDIGLVNKATGLPEPFIGIYGSTRITPIYRPNVGEIKKRYVALNGINPQDYSRAALQKGIDDFKLRQETDQSITNTTLNIAGRGFR